MQSQRQDGRADLHITVESRVVRCRHKYPIPSFAQKAEQVVQNGTASRLNDEVGWIDCNTLHFGDYNLNWAFLL